MNGPAFSVGIVGAGFSGTLLAVNLLRQTARAVRVTLIDRSGRFGPGLAYSSRNPQHLLNVRAANMSAFPGDPDHFWRWLQAHGLAGDAATSQAAFATRNSYGEYVGEIFRAAGAHPPPGSSLQPQAGEVVAAEPVGSRWRLRRGQGDAIEVDSLVLCLGNPPPTWPASFAQLPAHRHLIDNPWNLDAIDAIPRAVRVLVVGTGLTMVDVAIELIDNGHIGPIVAISRRGLLPQTHEASKPYPAFIGAGQEHPVRISQLARLIRRHVRLGEAQGIGWRGVMDSMRPALPALWRSLPEAEQRRFLRHAQTWWDVHRHRMAPQVASRIHAALRSGQLRAFGGRIQRIEIRGDRWRAAVQPRRTDGPSAIDFDAAINCSGPDLDFRRHADALVANLLASGAARLDRLGLGLDVTGERQVIGADGKAWPNLHAIGPLTKGAFWETTAVPELRIQADELAKRLAGG